jgi:hypothetical protein
MIKCINLKLFISLINALSFALIIKLLQSAKISYLSLVVFLFLISLIILNIYLKIKFNQILEYKRKEDYYLINYYNSFNRIFSEFIYLLIFLLFFFNQFVFSNFDLFTTVIFFSFIILLYFEKFNLLISISLFFLSIFLLIYQYFYLSDKSYFIYFVFLLFLIRQAFYHENKENLFSLKKFLLNIKSYENTKIDSYIKLKKEQSYFKINKRKLSIITFEKNDHKTIYMYYSNLFKILNLDVIINIKKISNVSYLEFIFKKEVKFIFLTDKKIINEIDYLIYSNVLKKKNLSKINNFYELKKIIIYNHKSMNEIEIKLLPEFERLVKKFLMKLNINFEINHYLFNANNLNQNIIFFTDNVYFPLSLKRIELKSFGQPLYKWPQKKNNIDFEQKLILNKNLNIINKSINLVNALIYGDYVEIEKNSKKLIENFKN